eukprot:gene20117-26123_t
MQLDEQWNWKSRKLACRVMQESGNPAGDELRERFAELVGLDLNNILNDMKNNRKRKETLNKSAALLETEEDRTFKSLLNRSHILGAAKISLDELKKKDDMFTNSKANDNLKKMYARLPKSPPRRVLLEIQRERAKPLQLPDQDEEAEAKAKKEKKLAKQRSSRLLPLEEKDLKRSIDESNSPRRPLTEILKHYEGDMFGSGGPYLESMLYLSRMSDSENKSHRFTHDSHVEDADKESKILPLNTTIEGKIDESSLQSDDYRNNNNNDDVSYTDNNSKLYCAASLCNWSRDPVNANRLASEGAIRAISQLFLENNSKIQRFCACAYRFMSEHLPLANAMIDEGVTNTMSDFIGQSSDDFICSNLAISIVNLTRIGGKEGQLVDAAVVLALQNLILIQPELSGTCARGLYNLTCVDTSYPFIERVIKALVTLSSSGVSNVKHICAAALCNLSDLRSVRPRLIEEGTVNVLSQLSRGAETRTRRICAVILQNLSASKICRIEMATKSGVTVAYSLSADQDPIILRAIGLTISRLSSEASNCNRIIYENGITALCNIAVKYPTIPGITQPIAVAFQLLAGRSQKRAITPTVRLSSMASIHSDSRIKSAIPTTKSIIEALGEHEECYELLAAILCVYLYDQKCRYNFSFPSIAEILLRIIQSKPNEQILHNTISALYGMSRMPKCREFLSVPPLNIDATLIALSHTESNNIKRNIARVLKNLSADSNEAIEEGAVAALIAISLEGKQKNKVGNDIYLPDINPIESDKLQTNTLTNNQLDTSTLLWYDTYDPILVEAAGKGPDPPSPPSMLVNSPDIYSSIYEDNDNSANDLLENKTKMAFAKMQIPSELKNSYLISEDEYKVRGSDDISRVDSQEEGESFGDGDSLHRGGDFDTNSESFPSNDNKIDIPINTNHSIHSDNKLSKSKSLSSSEHLKDKDNEKHSKSSGKTKKQSKSISFNTNNNAVISKSSEKAIELGLYS